MNIDECLRQVTMACSQFGDDEDWCDYCGVQIMAVAEKTVHKDDCPLGCLGKHIHNLQLTIRVLDGSYENKDPRCQYPFVLGNLLDYCWTYATHVDGKPEYADLEARCRECVHWKPEEKPSA
ncbi:hypothetical protein LCGC14_2826260, partial [marine sediment metagenome]